jgi:hypothetical protein
VLPRVADMMGEAAQVLSDASRLIDPAPDIVLEFAPLRQRILGASPSGSRARADPAGLRAGESQRIRTPTLVVWGADDMVAAAAHGVDAGRPATRRAAGRVPGVGHQVMAQAPTMLVPGDSNVTSPAPGRSARKRPHDHAGQGRPARGSLTFTWPASTDSIEIEDCPQRHARPGADDHLVNPTQHRQHHPLDLHGRHHRRHVDADRDGRARSAARSRWTPGRARSISRAS